MHLSLETTLDLIEGRIEASKVEMWDAHVKSCATCCAQMDEWRAVVELLSRKHLESAPQGVLYSAAALCQKSSEPKESIVTKVMELVFDSIAQPALAGARGIGGARHLVLRTEEFDVHLRVWGEAQALSMVGQILPRGEQKFLNDAKLHLLRNGERFESTASDPFGEFQFRHIPQGLLSLQIDLPKVTVVGALNMMDIY